MNLACCVWAIEGSENRVAARAAALGFEWIDVRPFAFSSDGARRRIREHGLSVSCIAASFGMPEGARLSSPDRDARLGAASYLDRTLDFGASLGASAAYVVPDEDPSSLDRYAAALERLAERGDELGVSVCVEHFPDTALPTASGTIAYLREIGHPNLFLLLDIGHAQMSGEDATEVISDAGPLLGYVHLDDNDGSRDLHLGLTDGILTEAALADTVSALADIGYRGNLSLELHPELPDPLDALGRSREIVLNAMG
ncbi:MAG: sugar phosphate isomerase/epimerase [Gemmatimonadota bacterium]|nr:sugar phosphate isomerase/epimerase [Gemmatimonadota bacterium]